VTLLSEDEAHVWIADPDWMREPELSERCLSLLGRGERERFERLRPEGPRRQFLAAHALKRLTLSRYASVEPRAWSFVAGAHGRPEIDRPSVGPPLRFNLTHTRGMVACAVIRELEIGIDVESPARRVRHREVAERFFGENEVKALLALAPERQLARFLDLWTLKEAYLKAAGRGISIPLSSFQFRISGEESPRIQFDPELLSDDPASWQFSLHHPGHGHTLALAIRRPDRLRVGIRLFEGFPLEPGATRSRAGRV
jgi:4'-phosphopantetheinyl transferase